MRAAVVALSLMMLASAAGAFPEMDGNHIAATQLRDKCMEREETLDYLFCLSYVGGVLDGITVGNLGSKLAGGRYIPMCAPDKKPLKYFVDVIKSHMLEKPEELIDKSAVVFIRVAMSENFPCDP